MRQIAKRMRCHSPVVLAGFLAVCLGGGCSSLTGIDKDDTVDVESRLLVSKLWSHSVVTDFSDEYLRLMPLLKDGRMYVAGPKGELVAFRVKDGKRLWRRSSELEITAGAGGGEETMIVGATDGKVVAFSLDSGEEIWQSDIGEQVTAVSKQHRGLVLVRTADRIVAMDAASGGKRWQYKDNPPPLTIKGASLPVFHRGSAFVGLDSGYVLVMDLKSGRVLSKVRLGVDVGSTDLDRIVDVDGRMVVEDGVLYAGAYQGRTVAVNLDNGEVVWTLNIASQSGLDVGNRRVFIATADNRVVALSRKTGKQIWSNDSLQKEYLSAPAVIGPFVIVGSDHGHFYWLSKKSGKLLERTKLAADAPAEFFVNGKKLIAFDQGGNVSAFRVTGYRKR